MRRFYMTTTDTERHSVAPGPDRASPRLPQACAARRVRLWGPALRDDRWHEVGTDRGAPVAAAQEYPCRPRAPPRARMSLHSGRQLDFSLGLRKRFRFVAHHRSSASRPAEAGTEGLTGTSVP